ncbi:SpaH/EbpB family LPXTG-anchored major pilin [Corynebacterium accolens]|uniref:SpaH/EbpB family LPXTG-anchored major pilin n=1 Tax=Corynebacterium accolens TaxID=38284 RepID=UPI0025426B9A|nr:SpaH/EbpB family LPXTG-anchored major pilin [Corynebacterium accolens]MDK4337612.1 SpaH/EbpB family LPXTG-anchored major pilin [Corynebacterium accolens]
MNKLKSALVAAVATGLVITAPGVGAVAFAQEAEGVQEVTAANPANIDANKTAKLTIHKHADADKTGGTGNGLVNEAFQGKDGLPGAKFKIARVDGYDLKTNAGWEKLSKAGLTADNVEENATLVGEQEVTTGPDGSIEVPNLPLGLYYVKETQAPQGHNVGESKAFLVTLPMTNPKERNKWNYDVHVYPKNNKVENPDKPTKTVADANSKVGEKISYVATSPVQAFDPLTKFQIRDFFPSNRLENGNVTSVKITGNPKATDGVNEVTLTNNDDYAVTVNQENGHLDVVLTASGIAKVNEFTADKDRKVVVDLSFDVKKIEGDVTTPIENKIGVTQDNTGTPGDDPEDPDEPDDDPENPWPRSYYGDVKITKTGANDQTLNGVTFDLYRCNGPKDMAAKALIENAATTGEDGTAVIRGLQANNWVNNQSLPLDEKTDNDPREYLAYCLVETQTAPGHELLAEPVKFQIQANNENKTVELTALDVKNNPSNGGFNLPLTGGKGVLFLLAGGVLLLVLAGGATYVLRRRES